MKSIITKSILTFSNNCSAFVSKCCAQVKTIPETLFDVDMKYIFLKIYLVIVALFVATTSDLPGCYPASQKPLRP